MKIVKATSWSCSLLLSLSIDLAYFAHLSRSDNAALHFDSSWSEDVAPVSTVDGVCDGERGGEDGRAVARTRGWPTLAEEHLLRLYGNDEGYRVW